MSIKTKPEKSDIFSYILIVMFAIAALGLLITMSKNDELIAENKKLTLAINESLGLLTESNANTAQCVTGWNHTLQLLEQCSADYEELRWKILQ